MNFERQNETFVNIVNDNPIKSELMETLTGNHGLDYSQFLMDLEDIFKEHDSKKKNSLIDKLITFRLKKIGVLVFHNHEKSLKYGNNYRNFITPKTKINSKLVLDDKEIYYSFINNLEKIYKKRSHPDLGKLIMFCVNYTIGEYFGNFKSDENNQYLNKKFYQDMDSSVAEINLDKLKNKGFAQSLEKASLAHNLLKFIGIPSVLKMSLKTRIEGEIISSGYSFCCIRTTKGNYIYDANNSVLFKNLEGDVKAVSPNLIQITDAQYDKLINNKPVEIVSTIKEKVFDGNKYLDRYKKIIVYA